MIKEINVKNCTYYYFDCGNILMDKKLYKNILVLCCLQQDKTSYGVKSAITYIISHNYAKIKLIHMIFCL